MKNRRITLTPVLILIVGFLTVCPVLMLILGSFSKGLGAFGQFTLEKYIAAYTDPAFAESVETPPGEINSLDVNRLRFALAGAELTGDAAFVFDNSTGMPQPEGTANLAITGINRLIDALVGMGMIPEEQAMGARMMLSLFAKPGETEDSLVSTIEFKADGSIYSNGQRIK